MKQNKKGKNCAVICFAGFFFLKNLCYEVFAKQKKKKCAEHYYLCVCSNNIPGQRQREPDQAGPSLPQANKNLSKVIATTPAYSPYQHIKALSRGGEKTKGLRRKMRCRRRRK
jgi:hypothetical protein